MQAPVVFHLTFLVAMLKLLPGSSYTIHDSSSVLDTIWLNYTKNFRPLYNQSETLYISISFTLVSINEVDEVGERISVTGIINLSWNDSFFTWNPNNYGGMDGFPLKRENIWAPDVIHVNPSKEVLRLTEDWHDLRVTSEGNVSYSFGNIFLSVCSFNIRFYPMDRQKCSIQIGTVGFLPTELQYIPLYTEIQMPFLEENGAWDIVSTNVKRRFGGMIVTFEIVLDRKSGYVLLNIICPIIFMSALNVLIFIMPTESGERVSYSITVLLAIAVLLTVVGDNLPKTSNPMSIYSYYLVSVLVSSICITFCTIFSLQIYHTPDDIPINSYWKGLVKFINGSVGCKNKDCTSIEPFDANRDQHNDDREDVIKDNEIIKRQKDNLVKKMDLNTLDSDRITWPMVSMALDKVFFLFYCVVLTIDTIVFMSIIAVGE